MASLEELREERIKKLDSIRKRGLEPYPAISGTRTEISLLIDSFSIYKKKKNISAVGRIRSIRKHGGSIFIDIDDGTGSIQCFFKKDILEDSFNDFDELIDIGDFIKVNGKLFLTKKHEKTIETNKWNILTKSIRPLPDKWHGLSDVEERFRRRYLDLLMSKDVRDCFIVRSKIVTELRNILDKNNFLEVETPSLQPLPGGATAKPFITHHNTLDIDLYLRVSPELYLKRLLVGGFPKVYEIGRDFRNEGIDQVHNPEFTMLEFYESYSDIDSQMIFVEKMIKSLIKKLFKKSSLIYQENSIDFSKKFVVISYFDLIKRYALISDPEGASLSDISLKAKQLGLSHEKNDTKEKILDIIYKKECRPKLIQPTFIINYPVEYLPLAKRNKENPKYVDAFQFVVSGIELAKAFSELNDPIDQGNRLKDEEKNKKGGDEEAQRFDIDFIEALEFGMPPAGGVGIGIDRLAMLLCNKENIKEVILFPTLRPKSN